MKKQKNMIGFDRKIRLSWLEATAELVAQGLTFPEIRLALNDLLENEVAGTAHNSARGKTKTVLLRTWGMIPAELKPLRDQALTLRQEIDGSQRLALHWGMLIANYPFFKQVADTIGRLSTLQGAFTSAQVQRRTVEIFGERETVRRATQRMISSMADWGVIRDAIEYGTYRVADVIPIDDKRLVLWLLQVTTLSQEPISINLDVLRNWPGFFPFKIAFSQMYDLEQCIYIGVQGQQKILGQCEIVQREQARKTAG